jgi:hypothetical protein
MIFFIINTNKRACENTKKVMLFNKLLKIVIQLDDVIMKINYYYYYFFNVK